MNQVLFAFVWGAILPFRGGSRSPGGPPSQKNGPSAIVGGSKKIQMTHPLLRLASLTWTFTLVVAKGVEVVLNAEQLLFEANTLLNGASLINRCSKS